MKNIVVFSIHAYYFKLVFVELVLIYLNLTEYIVIEKHYVII